jgi:hypothetical protein
VPIFGTFRLEAGNNLSSTPPRVASVSLSGVVSVLVVSVGSLRARVGVAGWSGDGACPVG